MDAELGDQTGLMSSGAFGEENIRKGFIKKVYSILTFQLALTMGVMGIFFVDSVKDYTSENIWLFWVAFFLSFGFLIALVCPCFGDLRRKTPHNMILLVGFTLAEGFMLGVAASTYSAHAVLMAVGITALVVLGLTIFAFQTKIDFTMCNGILFALLLCLMIFGIFCGIFRSDIMNVVYASLGAVIFSIYIVVDTQMMMGGKHQYSIDPEEYIFATLNLYLDIINLFMMILSLVGRSDN